MRLSFLLYKEVCFHSTFWEDEEEVEKSENIKKYTTRS